MHSGRIFGIERVMSGFHSIESVVGERCGSRHVARPIIGQCPQTLLPEHPEMFTIELRSTSYAKGSRNRTLHVVFQSRDRSRRSRRRHVALLGPRSRLRTRDSGQWSLSESMEFGTPSTNTAGKPLLRHDFQQNALTPPPHGRQHGRDRIFPHPIWSTSGRCCGHSFWIQPYITAIGRSWSAICPHCQSGLQTNSASVQSDTCGISPVLLWIRL